MVGPLLQRAPALVEIIGLVVDGGDAGFERSDVAEGGLDHMWRHAELVMRDSREEPSQVMQNPGRHRRLNASSLAGGGDALVECCLSPVPAGEAPAVAKDEVTSVLLPRFEDGDSFWHQWNDMRLAVLAS